MARLAEFYGPGIFQLTKEERLGLYANLDRMWAIRLKRELQASGRQLGHKATYHLELMATGDRELAEEASKAILKAQLQRGETPED